LGTKQKLTRMDKSNQEVDYLIVGSGFFGSILANHLNKKGKKVLVIDKKNHIGGNSHTEIKDDIVVHSYGPHIFHTSNEKVWKWINSFVKFNDFTLRPVANYKNEIYSLPFNMWTFSQIFNKSLPSEIEEELNKFKNFYKFPKNLKEQAINMVGPTVYEKLIKGYTEKQWRTSAENLPKEIIMRLPLRFTYDNNYFNDKYQGIPINGYSEIFDKLLEGIEVKLNFDYFKNKSELPNHKNVIYTGPIDKYFDYEFGQLEYKTLEFKHSKKKTNNYQGTAMMNFTDSETKHTRIVEYKHFNPERNTLNKNITYISKEYPVPYIPDKSEPLYPVNDDLNNNMYKKYKLKSDTLNNVYFGGRLAEYKYYDMDDIIESALKKIEEWEL
jgi:UDP-galactopyranose mutase